MRGLSQDEGHLDLVSRFSPNHPSSMSFSPKKPRVVFKVAQL